MPRARCTRTRASHQAHSSAARDASTYSGPAAAAAANQHPRSRPVFSHHSQGRLIFLKTGVRRRFFQDAFPRLPRRPALASRWSARAGDASRAPSRMDPSSSSWSSTCAGASRVAPARLLPPRTRPRRPRAARGPRTRRVAGAPHARWMPTTASRRAAALRCVFGRRRPVPAKSWTRMSAASNSSASSVPESTSPRASSLTSSSAPPPPAKTFSLSAPPPAGAGETPAAASSDAMAPRRGGEGRRPRGRSPARRKQSRRCSPGGWLKVNNRIAKSRMQHVR